jgi:hypothetical protein
MGPSTRPEIGPRSASLIASSEPNRGGKVTDVTPLKEARGSEVPEQATFHRSVIGPLWP